MYNQGDKGGTNHSVNMVSDQVAAQMAAIEQRNDDLEENQFKIADPLHQLAGDATIGSEGGIPPIIDTKLMDTAPTEGNTDLLSLMAQTQQNNQVLQVLKAVIENLSTGGSGGRRRNNSNKNSDNPPNITTIKGRGDTVYQKWNKYYHSC